MGPEGFEPQTFWFKSQTLCAIGVMDQETLEVSGFDWVQFSFKNKSLNFLKIAGCTQGMDQVGFEPTVSEF